MCLLFYLPEMLEKFFLSRHTYQMWLNVLPLIGVPRGNLLAVSMLLLCQYAGTINALAG